jgi:glycosyltransferase involved in cell wall biosynthesis
LSLFQIDTAEEGTEGQRPSFLLAKELTRRGYSFQYVIRRGSSLQRKAVDAGLPVLPLKVKNHRHGPSVLRLYLAMKRRKCRLVDVHDFRSMALGHAASSLAKVPLRIASGWKELPLKGIDILRRKYGQYMDAVTVVSKEMKESLINGGIEPRLIRVIPDGIDFSPFTAETPKGYLRREFSFAAGDFLIGMFVHLADEKGIRYLIQFTRYLKELIPSARWVILGEGRVDFRQQTQITELGGEELFFCLGFQEDLPRILHSLDVFALLSDAGRGDRVLLDAMASGLPVVVAKAGSLPPVIEDGKTGLAVPSGRPKSLVQAIGKIKENKDMARELGHNGRELVSQKYSVEAMASRTVDLYEDLAHKKGINLLKVV